MIKSSIESQTLHPDFWQAVLNRQPGDQIHSRWDWYCCLGNWIIWLPILSYWVEVSVSEDIRGTFRKGCTKVKTTVVLTNKQMHIYCMCKMYTFYKMNLFVLILTDSTAKLGAIFSLISISLSEKSCLSSVAMMDSTGVPSTFTPYCSRTPDWNNSTPEQSTRHQSKYKEYNLNQKLKLVEKSFRALPMSFSVCFHH